MKFINVHLEDMGSQDLIIVFTVVQHLKKVHTKYFFVFISFMSAICLHLFLFSEKTLHNHVCTNLVDIQSKEGEPLTCAKCDQSFASKR